MSKKTIFVRNCQLRIGRRKLNITSSQDLLFGKEYEYGPVTVFLNNDDSIKCWMWDADWIVPIISFEQMQEWTNNINIAMTKPVLELDEMKSLYSGKEKV